MKKGLLPYYEHIHVGVHAAEDELIAHTRKVHQHLSVAATNAERRAAAAARARAGASQTVCAIGIEFACAWFVCNLM